MSSDAHWSAIEKWLRSHAPDVFASLRAGAADERSTAFSGNSPSNYPPISRHPFAGMMGKRRMLPNGIFPLSGVLGPEPAFRLMSVAEIAREWRRMRELLDGGEFSRPGAPDRGVAGAWWHAGWVPVADNGGGDLFCVDLAPAPGGSPSQVLLFAHDSPERRRAAESFGAWLGALADCCSGRYEYTDEDGVVSSD